MTDPSDRATVSRRALAGGLGLAAAAAATPAAAQRRPDPVSAAPLRNPVEQYTRTPFPVQQQPWPGVQSRMTPRPDCGETSYRGSGRLAGRRALVTGGDSGIGRAAAIAFGREGADVAINYLPAEESDAREVAELIRAEGRRATLIPGDITSERFCTQLVERAVRELGGLDLLVNNAAYQQTKRSIFEITSEQFDRTFKTNVYAPFWITKAALRHMQPGAVIIMTASEQAFQPAENLVDYAQTKASNVAFTKSLAKQLAPRGIRVNAVAPGPYWTPLQVTGGQIPEEIPQFGQDTPYGRAGQPAEIAGLYVLLASAENSYASGQVFGSQGGEGAV